MFSLAAPVMAFVSYFGLGEVCACVHGAMCVCVCVCVKSAL